MGSGCETGVLSPWVAPGANHPGPWCVYSTQKAYSDLALVFQILLIVDLEMSLLVKMLVIVDLEMSLLIKTLITKNLHHLSS